MTRIARVFMDVSYTRTQHVHVGITRTVRRLEEELRRQFEAEGVSFSNLSFHSKGFRRAPPDALDAPAQHAARAMDKPAAGLFRWLTGAAFRRAVLMALALLPWPLLRWIWTHTSRWTFDLLARGEPAVRFAPGDVLFLCDASWNYPVWIAAARARAQGAKVVLLMYDLIPLRHPEFTFALVPHIFRLWLDRMLPVSDAVVSISRATQDDLRRFAHQAAMVLPPCGHFRLGSDPVRTQRAAHGVRAELDAFVNGAPVFAAIGSFEPKKNYGFLVDAFEEMWRRGDQVRLLIIGRESAECEALIARVRRHPEQGNRLLTLFDASDAEVARAYEACRALVFPSLAEGFGLPLVEARSRGAWVIASDLPCFEELADEGVAIYPRHSREMLARLVTDHARAAGPRPSAMPPFTWEDSAQSLRRLLADLPERVA